MSRAKRPDWDAARRQERAGPRTGNAGGLIHVPPPARKALRPVVLETRTVAGTPISVGCDGPLDFFVRFGEADWLPLGVLAAALEAYGPQPRRVPPRQPETHFAWWVEERRRGHFTFEWRQRESRGSVDLEVVRTVLAEWDAAWEDAFLERLEDEVQQVGRLSPEVYRAAAHAVAARRRSGAAG